MGCWTPYSVGWSVFCFLFHVLSLEIIDKLHYGQKICFVSFQPFYLYWDLLYDPEEWKAGFSVKVGIANILGFASQVMPLLCILCGFVQFYLGQPFKNAKTTLRSWTMQTQAMSHSGPTDGWPAVVGPLCAREKRWALLSLSSTFCQRPQVELVLQSAKSSYLSWLVVFACFFYHWENLHYICGLDSLSCLVLFPAFSG